MGPRSWKAIKLFLAVSAPMERLLTGKAETHLFCVRQALQIINNDGYGRYAKIIGDHIEFVKKGVLWADNGWKYLSHYYDPVTKNGLGPWPDARSECSHHFKKAAQNWKQGNGQKAFFYLGAASHLVQDLCVPHHAKAIAFNGHNVFERWVKRNYNSFSVDSDGLYNTCSEPGQWVENNAKIARRHYSYIASSTTDSAYSRVTSVLLPLAQRSTAGFFVYFLEYIKF